MHCSSFSKSLAPGYRVGWVAGGRYAEQIERLKLMTSLSASIPAQAAIADYLQHGGYDRHLRKAALRPGDPAERHARGGGALLPEQTRVSRPSGGYFLWLELPEAVDSLRLFQLALAQGISLARGRSSPPPAASPIAPGSTTGTRGARGRRRRWRHSGGSPSRWRDDAPQTESHPGVGRITARGHPP